MSRPVLGPGSSYNPEARAHQDALGEAVARVVAVQRRREDVLARVRPAPAGALVQDAHDPDDDGGAEVWAMLGAGVGAGPAAATAMPTALADVARGKPLGKWTKKKLRPSSGAKKATDRAAFDVQLADAKAALAAEEAALSAAGAGATAVVSGFAARQAAKQSMLASLADPIVRVPLSDELHGSLRAMKPVSGAALVLEHMQDMALSGRAHRRRRKFEAVRLAADGSAAVERVMTHNQMRRLKKVEGKTKLIEFPRRRGFEPADEIAEDAMRAAKGLDAKKRGK